MVWSIPKLVNTNGVGDTAIAAGTCATVIGIVSATESICTRACARPLRTAVMLPDALMRATVESVLMYPIGAPCSA